MCFVFSGVSTYPIPYFLEWSSEDLSPSFATTSSQPSTVGVQSSATATSPTASTMSLLMVSASGR